MTINKNMTKKKKKKIRNIKIENRSKKNYNKIQIYCTGMFCKACILKNAPLK